MSAESTDKTTEAPKPPQHKPPLLEYKMAEDTGAITRTDANGTIHVATYRATDKTLVLVEEWENFRPAVVRWLNENDMPPARIIRESDDTPTPKAAAPARVIPPMPKKNPRLGDKTPAVVDWYKRYKPEEYRARYGIIGPGMVTKTRKVLDPETGKTVTQAYEVEAVIAHRKIPGTEKLEANEARMAEEYDYTLDQPKG